MSFTILAASPNVDSQPGVVTSKEAEVEAEVEEQRVAAVVFVVPAVEA